VRTRLATLPAIGSAISLRSALSLLVPPRCAVCEASCSASEVVCRRCDLALDADHAAFVPVLGLDSVVAAAPYRGRARELVRALKFGARTPLAGRAARAIAAAIAPPLSGTAVVPVPPAPSRLLRRGFDPAEAIAAEVAAELGLPLDLCLVRSDGPRQVGRRRRARLADPPRIRLASPAPQRALVVDDVITTGATFAACARALRGGGCQAVIGAAYAHSVGSLGASGIEA
jgi:predicted amidophosphoribosyltransferase